jgi:hypothetical protein
MIEPPALALVRGRDEVESFIAAVDAARREATDAADYARRFITSFGFPPPKPPASERAVRAAAAAWRERPPWEATPALDRLAHAPFPKLVVRGAWDVSPPEAQRTGRAALHPVCDVLAETLGAADVTIPGAAHAAQRGASFNDELRSFWRDAA